MQGKRLLLSTQTRDVASMHTGKHGDMKRDQLASAILGGGARERMRQRRQGGGQCVNIIASISLGVSIHWDLDFTSSFLTDFIAKRVHVPC